MTPVNLPGTLRRPKTEQVKRTHPQANRPQPTAAIRLVSAVKGNGIITVTFDQAISLSGTPNYTTDVAGVTATSAVRNSPTVVTITFSGAVAAATKLNIPYEEKAVRNVSGGFVADSTFAVT